MLRTNKVNVNKTLYAYVTSNNNGLVAVDAVMDVLIIILKFNNKVITQQWTGILQVVCASSGNKPNLHLSAS